MEVLSIRPAPPGSGNTLARFDVQLDGGVRLFNLKLASGQAGLRAHAASAFGSPTATFTPETAAEIVRLASAALGDISHYDRSAA